MRTLQDKSTASSAAAGHVEQARSQFLAHHFDSPRQQFEASKLGMWLFLATEVLLFGGLFCAYAVFRANHPEIFVYGSQFLDTTWGAINTAVLIVSSLTMALAVWCAQCGRRRELVLFLGLTLMCAVDFLGIKYIEYSHKFHDNLVWGVRFYEGRSLSAGGSTQETGGDVPETVALEPGDADRGRVLYRNTCSACHGQSGEGLPRLGKPLRTSQFVTDLNDTDLLEFLNAGRPAGDPLNTTGVAMLPKGGNPTLKDQDLLDIIAFVRSLQERARGMAGAEAFAEAELPAQSVEDQLLIPKSVIPLAAIGPPGLASHSIEEQRTTNEPPGLPDRRRVKERPANAHLFFGIYFGMTGLHALHVVAGIVVISWLLVRSLKGQFNREYFTPVDLGGLYWHVVDVIWIFLFPLLYLIG